ncbi:MAG: helix-turn-helix domain-containing protein [Kiloniellales bacterium]
MHVAAHELINGRKSILQIAQEVGYESEASFTRAFKRAMGKPPGAWRRNETKTRSPSAPSRRRGRGASPRSSRSPGRRPRSAPAWRCGR